MKYLKYTFAIVTVLLSCCWAFAADEIPGKGTTWGADAMNSYGGLPAPNAIDNNANTWWQGAALPTWHRINLGTPYRVQQYDLTIRDGNHVIRNYEIYVTNDGTTVKANWGTPVATGTFPNTGGPFSIPLMPRNGQYVIFYAASVYANNATIREATLYGDSVGPVMLPDPAAIRMYTNTASSASYSVVYPPDPAAPILADIEVSDSMVFSSIVVGGVNVTDGGTDVMTFDGDPDWACEEGAIAINSSDAVGSTTIQAVESTSVDYTPQNVLGAPINVEVVQRVVKMNGLLVIGLPFDGVDSRSVQIVDAELPAPGYVPITLGTPSGTSAQITTLGDIGIFDGDFDSSGSIEVVASSATPGFTTVTVTAGNDFIFQESGTDSVILSVLVTPSPDLYVSVDGSDDTGDGTQANPFRTITHALQFAAAVPNVHVGPGTYDASGEAFPLAIPKGVSISAWAADGFAIPDDYVIDGGSNAVRLFTYTNVPTEESCSLDGFTMINARVTAITCSGATLAVSNCVFTGIITPQDSFWEAGGPSVILLQNDSKVTLTACSFTGNSGRGTIGFQEGTANNNGSLTASGCTWTDNFASIGTIYGHNNVVARTTLTDCVFTDNKSATSGTHDAPPGTMFYAIGGGTNPVVIERCIASGGIGGSVLSGRNNEFQVRNSLFFNNAPAAGNQFIHGYNWGANIVNSTFADNTGSFTGRHPGRNVNVRNSIISGQSVLTTATDDGQKRLTLTNVMLWNSPVGVGYLPASTGIIELDPQFRSSGNYHLRATSPAIDVGDNSLVIGDVDLDGTPRILDGKSTGDEIVDLGAYEYDPSVAVPAFKTPQHEYSVYSGSTLSVPVSIDPAVAGAVTADVTYGADLFGPASISIPNGAGPVDLAVTIGDTITTPGAASAVQIAESSSQGVDPGDFLLFLYAREATMAGTGRIFVKAGAAVDLRVTIPAGAPGDVAITVGATAGTGTNVITWSGAAVIPDGAVESTGMLTVIGDSGTNSITLSIGSGFVFTETGTASLTLSVVQVASPAYVSADGSDLTGDGTLANPFASIGFAAAALEAGDEVRVLPGTYAAPAESFPIQPGSVRVVAFDPEGPVDPANHVVNGSGASVNLFAFTDTPAGETGYLAGLTLTGCTKTAIACSGGALAVDGCVFTGIITPNFSFWDPYGYSNSIALINDSKVTATGCTFSGNKGRGTVGADLDQANQNNAFTASGCTWTGNTSIIGTVYARFEVNMITSLTECTFDGNATSGNDTHDAPPSCVLYTNIRTGVPSVAIDRCTIINNTGGSILSPSQVRPIRISNTLFANNAAGVGSSQQFIHGYNWGAVVTNCTFVNNTGSLTAWELTGNTFQLQNSIVSGQSVLSSNGQQAKLFLHNVILWNTPAGDGYNAAGSSDVIEQDPLLVDASAATLDLHLADGSPAIDAGSNDFVAPEHLVDLDGNPRIVDGNGDDVDTVDIGCYEYQGAAGATVATFIVSDRTSGSTLVTNEAAVAVAITANVPEGITVANWQVTESDVEPAEWLAEAPTTYTIQAASGADVTLYAWIKDSADNVASKPATIYYDTRLPVVSNVVVTAGAPGSATVTWDTDIPAVGSVNYGPVSMAGTTPNTSAENALGTSHSVVITGLADGTNYKIVLVNNEVAATPAYFWPKAWPIDGDANMDCRVNILDLIFIRNKLNLDVATGDNWKADINKDGRINILDLIYVRNKLNTACP